MKLFTALLAAAVLSACSESIPDYGTGPFRGTLFDMGTLEPLPVLPSQLTSDVEVAVAPEPALEEVVEPPPIPVVEAEAEPVEQIMIAEPEAPEEIAPVEPDPNEEVQLMNFDDMADFDYTAPTLDEIDNATERPEQVPAEILAFNNALVEIEGYMIPIEVEQGKVRSFILSRTLSGCCFGDMPNIQEWVDVRMQDGTDADYIPYAPVLVIGRMSVGELVDEYGITSLYRMTAESVEDPW